MLRWLLEGRPPKSAPLGLFHAPSRLVRSGRRRIVRVIDGWPSTVTGACLRVYQPGGKDFRGPIAKNGPKYLRWALIEAAVQASSHPSYKNHYDRTKTRLRSPTRRRGREYPSSPQARRGHLAQALSRTLPVAVSSE